LKPRQINVYIWEPKHKHDYGRLGFTATPAACETLATACREAVRLLREHQFELPETTQQDLKHIGDRMKMCYRSLAVGPDNQDGSLVRVHLDREQQHLQMAIPVSALEAFIAMLTEVADDHGDLDFDVEIKGKRAHIFYWPCFGHIYKTGEPRNRFPEWNLERMAHLSHLWPDSATPPGSVIGCGRKPGVGYADALATIGDPAGVGPGSRTDSLRSQLANAATKSAGASAHSQS
jgi:hypothetical protein